MAENKSFEEALRDVIRLAPFAGGEPSTSRRRRSQSVVSTRRESSGK